MKRSKQASSFLRNDFLALMKKTMDKNFPDRKDKKFIEIEVYENNEKLSFFYDCEKKTTTDTPQETLYKARYNEEKGGFEVLRSTVFTDRKSTNFLCFDDELMYLCGSVLFLETYFFPCESGIPDENTFKNVRLERNYSPSKYVWIYDLINKEYSYVTSFYFLFPNSDIATAIEQPQNPSYLRDVVSSCKENDFIVSDNDNKERFNEMSVADYILSVVSNIRKQKTTTSKIEKAKKKINELSDFKSITKKLKTVKRSTFIKLDSKENKEEYELTCNLCSHKNKVCDCFIVDDVIQYICPHCHNEVKFTEKDSSRQYEKIYFELLDNKDILIYKFVQKKTGCKLFQAYLINPSGIEAIYDEILYNYMKCENILVNTKEELKQIFDNSNISNLRIPDIIGINAEHPERKMCDILELNVFIKYLSSFIECPFLTQDIEKYGVNVVNNAAKTKFLFKKEMKNLMAINEIYGLSPEIFEIFVRSECPFSLSFATYISKINSIRPEENIENIIKICSKEDVQDILDSDFISIFSILYTYRDIEFQQLLEYIKQCKQYQGMKASIVASYYLKYLFYAIKLKYDLTDESVLFPSELKKQYKISYKKLYSEDSGITPEEVPDAFN